MKKIAFILLMSVCISGYAQGQGYPKGDYNQESYARNTLDLAGIQLKRSANYQYGAIGLAAASAGLFIASSFMQDDYSMEKGELVKEKNDTRKTLLIAGGVCALTAVCCELFSISLKAKAGKSLRIYSTGNGGGIKLTF